MEAFLKASSRTTWDAIEDRNEAFLEEIEDKDLKMLMQPVSDEGSDGSDFDDDEEEEQEQEDETEEQDFDEDQEDDDFQERKTFKNVNYEEEEDKEPKKLSTFERAQQKLRHTISQLERENVSERPWNMMGEVSAKQRPLDSLLQEDLDFERASRPAPVHTEETTGSIESIIKQRIKDQAFDNVEKPSSRTTAPPASSKRKLPEIEDGKSGKSLTEVLEADYQAARNNPVAPKTTEVHNQLGILFGKLCARLDALSVNSSSMQNCKFVQPKYSLAAPIDRDLVVKVQKKKLVNKSY